MDLSPAASFPKKPPSPGVSSIEVLSPQHRIQATDFLRNVLRNTALYELQATIRMFAHSRANTVWGAGMQLQSNCL